MIKYERGLSHSYVIFTDENKQSDDLTISMLRENKIEGLLPLKVTILNSVAEVAYEISGYHNMKKLLEATRINHKQIMLILETMQSLSENMEAYYLESEKLVLDPEYIYCDEELTEVLFCYDITAEVSGKKGLFSLSELILESADYNDYKSVVYAYELRQAIKTENFSLSNVIEKLRCVGSFSEYNTIPEPAFIADNTLSFSNEESKDIVTESEEAPVEESRESNQPVIHDKLKTSDFDKEDDWENEEPSGKLFSFSKKKKVKKAKNTKKSDADDMDFMEESFFHVGKIDSPGENKVFESKRYEICSVDGSFENMVMESYPFLIGSLQYAVDGCISDSNISRFHARFDQNMGKVYLSDLNSATGTYLNGEKLKGSVQMEIKQGDKIRFGNLNFVMK